MPYKCTQSVECTHWSIKCNNLGNKASVLTKRKAIDTDKGVLTQSLGWLVLPQAPKPVSKKVNLASENLFSNRCVSRSVKLFNDDPTLGLTCRRRREPPPIPLPTWESALARSSNDDRDKDRRRVVVEINERLGKEYIIGLLAVVMMTMTRGKLGTVQMRS